MRPLEEFVVPGVLSMWHCPQCGLYQQGQLPETQHYSICYHDSYASHRHRKLRTAAARLARVAGRLEVETPRLLDIGCSLGFTVEMAAQLGWDAQGVDISEDAVELCCQRGLNCHQASAVDLPYDDRTFDVVTAWHVIEHIDNAAATLAEWSRVLVPGGLLVLETPDSSCLKVRLLGPRYRRFWTPEHVYVFNRQNLIPLIEAAGLDVVPAPVLGRLGQLPPGLALYSIGYRLHKGMMSWLGLDKAFQLFCRRRSVALEAQPLRRAA
jgi:SAM-dependent methyltransferase